MTDKEKILKKIHDEMDGLMDAQGNFEYPEHEGAYHALCNLEAYIDSMPEEPASDDLDKFAAQSANKLYPPEYEMADDNWKQRAGYVKGCKDGAKWQKKQMMKSAKLSGWVARDENGDLRIFEVIPKRSSDDNKWWDRDYQCTLLDRNLFPDLKWEDEPVYVKLPIIVED